MMRSSLITTAIFFCIISLGCAPQKSEIIIDKNISNQSVIMNDKLLQFQVTGYENGGNMPAKFATKNGGGENVSIGAKWQILPAAQSYALLFYDKHPMASNWTHWLVADIPNTDTEIPEGASRSNKMPAGSRELKTSWDRTGYDGPQPPVGSGSHEYVAILYALNIPKLGLPEDASRDEFLKAIETHVIAQESWSGYFLR